MWWALMMQKIKKNMSSYWNEPMTFMLMVEATIKTKGNRRVQARILLDSGSNIYTIDCVGAQWDAGDQPKNYCWDYLSQV